MKDGDYKKIIKEIKTKREEAKKKRILEEYEKSLREIEMKGAMIDQYRVMCEDPVLFDIEYLKNLFGIE